MVQYNAAERRLKFYKVQGDDNPLDLYSFQRNSYNEYVQHTYLDDMQFLADAIQDKFPISSLTANFRCVKVESSGWRRRSSALPREFLQVDGQFVIDGIKFPTPPENLPCAENEAWIPIIRIPLMDSAGILNFDGTRYVCICQLTVADCISYDAQGGRTQLSIPVRNISFDYKSDDVMLRYGSGSKALHSVINCFRWHEGLDALPDDYFAHPFIQAAFASSAGETLEVTALAMSKDKVYETYTGPNYVLGEARAHLNNACTLYRAIGYTLSRNIPGSPYGKGDMVTDEVVRWCRKNLVNELYVRDTPKVLGYTLAQPIVIGVLPEGSRVVGKLKTHLEEVYARGNLPPEVLTSIRLALDTQSVPCDLDLREEILYLGIGTNIDLDILDLIRDSGHDEMMVSKTKLSTPFMVKFEREVIGNYTVRLSEVLGSNIPDGRSADEWVYFYNNPNLAPTTEADQHLNSHDLCAIYSLTCYMHDHPEHGDLLDKDAGVLKKVIGPNEMFSKAFRAVVPNFLQKYSRSIGQAINQKSMIDTSKFRLFGIYDMWKGYLHEHRYMDLASTQNPIAHITQANQLVLEQVGHEPPDKVRLLAMGYYGRICPLETPSSAKIGITNTKALGAKVRNGQILTGYRRVLTNSSGHITGISKAVTYMTTEEETNYVVGDILSLVPDGKGGYKDTPVVARVPAGNGTHTIRQVQSSALQFVQADTRGSISPTASLVPFLGCNDSARASLSTAMIKQSILLARPENPRVMTSTYREMFYGDSTYVLRSDVDGVVDLSFPDTISIMMADGDSTDYVYEAVTITNQTVLIWNRTVSDGQHVKKGDVLAYTSVAKNAIYSPGVNLFAAYIPNGYNYEDAIEISESCASKLTSISLETVESNVGRMDSAPRGLTENYFHFISENSEIANISYLKKGIRTNHVIGSGMRSGILLNVEMAKSSGNSKSSTYAATMVSYNHTRIGDKLVARHANKGTISIITKNSDMYRFANGVPIDIVLNPCGIPSRLNIGQNYEAFFGFVAHLLDITIESDSYNGATVREVRDMMEYVWEICNGAAPRSLASKFPWIPDAIHQRAEERLDYMHSWAGCFNKDGTARLYNPQTGKFLYTPATFGVPYFLKLEHEVNRKIVSRGGMSEDESYSLIYKQPAPGLDSAKGQKMGEMEMCNYAAYGAENLLHETINEDSDSVLGRLMLARHELTPDTTYTDIGLPRSVEMLRYYFEVFGVKMSTDAGDPLTIPQDSHAACMRKTIPTISSLTMKAPQSIDKSSEEEFKMGLQGIAEKIKNRGENHDG